VGGTVLQVRVHWQDDGIVLAVGELLQPGGIGPTVVLKCHSNAAAGRLPTRIWCGNEPVAQVAVPPHTDSGRHSGITRHCLFVRLVLLRGVGPQKLSHEDGEPAEEDNESSSEGGSLVVHGLSLWKKPAPCSPARYRPENVWGSNTLVSARVSSRPRLRASIESAAR
jgi:hypothetical protein